MDIIDTITAKIFDLEMTLTQDRLEKSSLTAEKEDIFTRLKEILENNFSVMRIKKLIDNMTSPQYYQQYYDCYNNYYLKFQQYIEIITYIEQEKEKNVLVSGYSLIFTCLGSFDNMDADGMSY